MLRAQRVLRRFIASSWETLTGSARNEILEPVWAMYEASYRAIGMHLASPSALLKYDVWMVAGGAEPTAFITWTSEAHGLKLGVCGTNGSSEGKSAMKSHLVASLNRSGYFGEVSHAIEKITGGVDVVCARYVEEVLGKPIEPSADGIHYKRNLQGVGMVEKKMVGHPSGVPTQGGSNVACPKPEEMTVTASFDKLSEEERREAATHFACMLDLDD